MRCRSVGCGTPNRAAASNAIGYAKFFSRSHDAVIRVYDEAGTVIEMHEQPAERADATDYPDVQRLDASSFSR
jgi:hypothetical protein